MSQRRQYKSGLFLKAILCVFLLCSAYRGIVRNLIWQGQQVVRIDFIVDSMGRDSILLLLLSIVLLSIVLLLSILLLLSMMLLLLLSILEFFKLVSSICNLLSVVSLVALSKLQSKDYLLISINKKKLVPQYSLFQVIHSLPSCLIKVSLITRSIK